MCGARYKTRPGLTYHYTHSHKDRDDEDCSSSGVGGPEGGSMGSVDRGASPSVKQQQQQQLLQQAQVVASQAQATADPGAAAGWSKFQDSYLTFLKTPGMLTCCLSEPLARPSPTYLTPSYAKTWVWSSSPWDWQHLPHGFEAVT